MNLNTIKPVITITVEQQFVLFFWSNLHTTTHVFEMFLYGKLLKCHHRIHFSCQKWSQRWGSRLASSSSATSDGCQRLRQPLEAIENRRGLVRRWRTGMLSTEATRKVLHHGRVQNWDDGESAHFAFNTYYNKNP